MSIIATENNINFPEKPHHNAKEKSVAQEILSLALFIISFYFLLGRKIETTLIIVTVVFIHELGHFIIMKLYKYQNTKIFFVPLMGGLATGDKSEVSQKQELWVLFMGPIPGIIIGVILFYIGFDDGNLFLKKTGLFFLSVNLFNLLPIYPLDGGKIIQGIFFSSSNTITKVFVWISIISLTLIAYFLEEYFLLIIPFFLLIQQKVRSDINKIKIEAEAQKINLQVSFENLSNSDYWLIRDLIANYATAFKKIITIGYYEVSDKEQRVINYIKGILKKPVLQDLNNKQRAIFFISWLVFLIGPIILILYKIIN